MGYKASVLLVNFKLSWHQLLLKILYSYEKTKIVSDY